MPLILEFQRSKVAWIHGTLVMLYRNSPTERVLITEPNLPYIKYTQKKIVLTLNSFVNFILLKARGSQGGHKKRTIESHLIVVLQDGVSRIPTFKTLLFRS